MSSRTHTNDLQTPLISDTSSINIGAGDAGSTKAESISSFFSGRRLRDDEEAAGVVGEEEMRRLSKDAGSDRDEKLNSTLSDGSTINGNRESVLFSIAQNMLTLIILPFVVGALVCLLSWRNRGVTREGTIFNNRMDWFVLFVLGLLHQSTLIVPVMWSTGAYEVLVTKLRSRGDFYGPFFIYPASAMLYSLMLAMFWRHQRRNRSRYKQSMRATRRQMIEQHREVIRGQVSVRSEFWCLGPSFFMSAAAWLLMRICALTESVCAPYMFTFLNPDFASEIYFEMSNYFDFVNFFVFTSVLSFALMYYFQQWRAMREFVYSDTTADTVNDLDDDDSSRRLRNTDSWLKRMPQNNSALSPFSPSKRARKKKPWMDLGAREGLAEYAGVFQALTSDLKYQPLSNAVTGVSFFSTALILVGGGVAVVVQNIFAGDHVAEFSVGVIALIGVALPFFVGFIYVTTQIENVIESLNAAISRVHLDVQVEISEGDMFIPPDRKKALCAKVSALQALDRYVRLTGGTPRLSGLSLNSLKWTGIFVGLFTLNCCFFFLYITRCRNS
jgi:hypothetical protein